jgi:hypothetical protein
MVSWHTYSMPTNPNRSPNPLSTSNAGCSSRLPICGLPPSALSLSPQSLHSPELPGLSFREKHPAILYGRQQGRRFSLYVPEELVPQVQRWLDNGRALQELYQAASAKSASFEARKGRGLRKKRRTENSPGLRSRRSVSPIGSCCSRASCWSHFCRTSPIFWTITKR